MPKLLMIKPSSLGDIIHGLQVAQSIREQMPGIEIDWVVRDRFRDIVELSDVVDNVYIFERKKGLHAFLKLLKTIRAKRYDYCLDFQGLLRTGIMSFAARAKTKIGRTDAREGATLFYDYKAPLPPMGRLSHAVEVLLQFLPVMGLKQELLGKVTYKSSPLAEIDRRLEGRAPIVLIPNSRQPNKEWQGFKALAKDLRKKYPNDLIVWDSHISIPTPEFDGDSGFINTSGKTSVPEMISLISAAKLVIANDSGPMHLAASMGKPVIALFGPTPPQRFAPYPPERETNHVIVAPGGDLSQLKVEVVSKYVSEVLDDLRVKAAV